MYVIVVPPFWNAMVHVAIGTGKCLCGKPMTPKWRFVRKVRTPDEAKQASTCNRCKRSVELITPKP